MILLIHLLEHLGVPSGAATAIVIAPARNSSRAGPRNSGATMTTTTAAKGTRVNTDECMTPVTGIPLCQAVVRHPPLSNH